MIRLGQITPENHQAFQNLIPKDLMREVNHNRNLYGIGLVENESAPPFAALLFEADEEEDDEGVFHSIAVIRWMYVEEEKRERNAAIFLFRALLNLLEGSGAEAIRCDVPMDAQYNLFCGMLEKFGFHFSLTDIYMLIRPLKDFAHLSVFERKLTMEVKPLSEVPEKLFALSLSEMNKQRSMKALQLSGQKSDYDEDLSCAAMGPSYPAGLFLVKELGENLLDVSFLRLLGKGDPKVVQQMIIFAGREAIKKYGTDALVRIHVHTEQGGRLIDRLLPDAEPLLVRRGYFYL